MVYESDFYTTRRPYTRPTATSYSISTPRHYVVDDPVERNTSSTRREYTSSYNYRSDGSRPDRSYSTSEKTSRSTAGGPGSYNSSSTTESRSSSGGYPGSYHASYSSTSSGTLPHGTSYRHFHYRKTVPIRHKYAGLREPSFLISKPMAHFHDEAKNIRAEAGALLRRVHSSIPKPAKQLSFILPYTELSFADKVNSDMFVKRILDPHSVVANDILTASYYADPARVSIGRGHLACIEFAGGRGYPRRTSRLHRDENRIIGDEIKFRSYYTKPEDDPNLLPTGFASRLMRLSPKPIDRPIKQYTKTKSTPSTVLENYGSSTNIVKPKSYTQSQRLNKEPTIDTDEFKQTNDRKFKKELEEKNAAEEKARLKEEQQKADEQIKLAEEKRKAEEKKAAAEKLKADQEAKAQEEARLKAEKAAKLKAEEEARLKAEEEAKLKEEEERLKAEAAQLQAEEDARLKAEEEARLKAEEEARLKAEEEAQLKAEEEARLKIEEEARIKAEEEARIKAEEDARLKAEEEALLKADEEAQLNVERDELKAEEEENINTQIEESTEKENEVSLSKVEETEMANSAEQQQQDSNDSLNVEQSDSVPENLPTSNVSDASCLKSLEDSSNIEDVTTNTDLQNEVDVAPMSEAIVEEPVTPELKSDEPQSPDETEE